MDNTEFVRQYALLKRVDAKIPTPNLYLLSESLMDKLEQHTGPMAFDYETSGLRWMDKDFKVRSVSFHNNDISLAIDIAHPATDPLTVRRLFNYIAQHKGLIAHNAQFESGVTFRMTGITPAILCCTRALGMQLAGEGSPGQSWGLKFMAKELLGWADWSKGIDMSGVMFMDWNKLGYYNQIDSAATWELFCMMREVVEDNKTGWGKYFWEYHQQDFMNLVDLQIQAYTEGLNIDLDKVAKYQEVVDQEIKDRREAFLKHPEVEHGVNTFNKDVVDQILVESNFTKQFKKDGSETIAWQKVQQKLKLALEAQHFNMDSNNHLKWLLYSFLRITPPRKTKAGAASVDFESLERIPVFGDMLLEYRASISMYKFLRALITNQKGGMVRIPIKTPGTITGRCSSGEVE